MTGPWYLQHAARLIRAGALVAYPTEAVYGLGCDPANEDAVMRLLLVKQRPLHKGLILLGADFDQLSPWVQLSAGQQQRLARDWPVGVTYLIQASPRVPDWIRGRHHKVAVRVSGHPLATALARLAGTPLVSTSANLSGRPALRNLFQVGRQLGAQVDLIVPGQCNISRSPSTIIDLDTGLTVRP